MARQPIDLHQKVKDVLKHTGPLPPESSSPIAHYERAINANFLLIKYIENHLVATGYYQSVRDGHLSHLHRLVLANLIETFERFIKELASVCVDQVAAFVNDGRYDDFSARGGQIVAHFGAATLGKALCESDTWLNNNEINDRFRKMLRSPFGEPWEFLFPNEKQPPETERATARTLAILWQVRHNLTHNSGVLTGSDSVKLRILLKGAVGSNCVLVPIKDDLNYVKRFLTETAGHANQRVGARLAALLTELLQDDNSRFSAQDKAKELSRVFHTPLTVSGVQGVV